MRCSVKGCKRNSRTDKVGFHRFPTTSSLRSQWIQFCDDEDLVVKPSSRVCGVHFDKNTAFEYNWLGKQVKCKNAIPTIKENMQEDNLSLEDAEECLDETQQPLPLYSSPALFDHTYADFIGEDPNPEDYFGDDEDALNGSAVMDSLKEREAQWKLQTEHQPARKCCAKNVRLLNYWRKRAQFWKAEFLKLNKQFEVPDRLRRIFNDDQIQIALGQKKKIKKWSKATIIRGLQTRFACGKGYEYLREHNLPYPATRTLLEHIQGVPFDTGVLEDFMILLKDKLSSMDDSARDCGLYLDEMSIDDAKELCPNLKKWYGNTTLPPSETLATKALVFMLGGIDQRWKQTVAYEFTGNSIPPDDLKSAVTKIIDLAEGLDIRVHFVTSDCGSANRAMWTEFGVHVRKNTLDEDLSIQHPVDPSRRLEFIADPVHIFKNSVHGWISNEQITLPQWYVDKHGLSSNIVDRNHLKVLVADDSKQVAFYRLTNRLKPTDVDFENCPLSNVDKMKVSHATKYCNYSVAAALEVVAEKTGKMELKTTAAYIYDWAKWYDIMNSRDDNHTLKPADTEDYSSALEHLSMMCELFGQLSVGEKGHWKPWQTAAVMSTKAVLRLQSYLFDKGYTEFNTSRTSQDCVENLFSIVRGKQKRPTALQMKQHLRTICLSQYMLVPEHSSYNVDERQHLVSLSDFIEANRVSRPSKRKYPNSVLEETTSSPEPSTSLSPNVQKPPHVCDSVCDSTSPSHPSKRKKLNSSDDYSLPVLGETTSSPEPSTSLSPNIQKPPSRPPHVCDSASPSAADIVASYDRAKLSSLFHVSRTILSSISSDLCQKCVKSCVASTPFNEEISRYSMKLLEMEKKAMKYPSRDFFDYFIALDYLYNKSQGDEKYENLFSLPMPLNIHDCHHLKEKLIKTLIRFRSNSERVSKMRKAKYDSRSMVV